MTAPAELPDNIMLSLPDDRCLCLEMTFALEWHREDSGNPAESGCKCDAHLDSGLLYVPDGDAPDGKRCRGLELNADQVEKLIGKDEIKRLEDWAAALSWFMA